MKRKWKFFIGGLVVVAALGYLGYQGFIASAAYQYELGEYLAQPGIDASQNVQVAGQVATGSIEQKSFDLKFTMTDGVNNMVVVYQGTVPDSFRAGGEVVVAGRRDPASGVFEATQVMPKCASKYVAE
ncbi:MAG: cytochrome c maturation protein CcmE [Chloroflexi bacterium]|nr:cytochrome c maturation protein CcmE [Chloroflexota bacterium]